MQCWFGSSTRSRILNGACCLWPKLRAELQVSHIRIIANQKAHVCFLCSSSSLSLELDAYTLTLRLNPEPQNPKPQNPEPQPKDKKLGSD